MKSTHQLEVEAFMLRARQEVPIVATEPSEAVRLLRAKLIFEEAMETIAGLGVAVMMPLGGDEYLDVVPGKSEFAVRGSFDMAEVIDGCCDIAVVTTGTLSACGVPDLPFQNEVNANNLRKFGPGHTIREDGKLVKPPGHKPPDIAGILDSLLG